MTILSYLSFDFCKTFPVSLCAACRFASQFLIRGALPIVSPLSNPHFASVLRCVDGVKVGALVVMARWLASVGGDGESAGGEGGCVGGDGGSACGDAGSVGGDGGSVVGDGGSAGGEGGSAGGDGEW